MKKTICFLFTVFMLLAASGVYAASSMPKMNISWTINTTGITQFKLYYASSPDMVNKQLHQECVAPTEDPTGSGNYSMRCTNIPISSYPAYIQVVGQSTDQSEIPSNVQKIPSEPLYSPDIIEIIMY